MSLGDIVGRNGLHGEVFRNLHLVAVCHDLAISQHISTTFVGDETSLLFADLFNGALVEMVAVFMGNEDIIGFRHRCVVDRPLSEFTHGVYLNLLSFIDDSDASVRQRIEFDGLTALCLEHIHFRCVLCRRHLFLFPCENTT